jgi:hypothetical protein
MFSCAWAGQAWAFFSPMPCDSCRIRGGGFKGLEMIPLITGYLYRMPDILNNICFITNVIYPVQPGLSRNVLDDARKKSPPLWNGGHGV